MEGGRGTKNDNDKISEVENNFVNYKTTLIVMGFFQKQNYDFRVRKIV